MKRRSMRKGRYGFKLKAELRYCAFTPPQSRGMEVVVALGIVIAFQLIMKPHDSLKVLALVLELSKIILK